MTNNATVLAEIAQRAKEAFHSGEREVFIYKAPRYRSYEIDCIELGIEPRLGDVVDSRERYGWEIESKRSVGAHVTSLIEAAIEASEGHYLAIPVHSEFEPPQYAVKIQYTVGARLTRDDKLMWLSLWFGISKLDMEKVASAFDDLDLSSDEDL